MADDKNIERLEKRLDEHDKTKVTTEVTLAKLDLRVATLEVNVGAVKRFGYWALLLLLAGIGTPFVAWLLKGGIYVVPDARPAIISTETTGKK